MRLNGAGGIQFGAARGVARELRERDERDRNRANSPLKPAADAIVD